MASAGTVHVEVDTSGFGAPSGYLDMNLGAHTGERSGGQYQLDALAHRGG